MDDISSSTHHHTFHPHYSEWKDWAAGAVVREGISMSSSEFDAHSLAIIKDSYQFFVGTLKLVWQAFSSLIQNAIESPNSATTEWWGRFVIHGCSSLGLESWLDLKCCIHSSSAWRMLSSALLVHVRVATGRHIAHFWWVKNLMLFDMERRGFWCSHSTGERE